MAERRQPRPPSGEAVLLDHPRAARDLQRARGWGGMLAFVLVGLLSLQAGAGPADALARALVAGAVGLTAAWACAILAWRALARAQMRAAHEKALGRAEEARVAAEETRRRLEERRRDRATAR